MTQPHLEVLESENIIKSINSFVVKLTKRKPNWHYHPENELLYIISGDGIQQVGDHVSEFKSGDLILLGENLPHDFNISNNADNAEVLVITFPSNILSKFPEFQAMLTLIDKAKYGLLLNQTPKSVRSILSDFNSKELPTQLVNLFIVLSKLSEKTSHFQQLSSINFSAFHVDINSQGRLVKVINYVNEHQGQSINLKEISSVANMTPPAFCRWFKKLMHITFVCYLNKVRIQEACRLLITTDKAISEIAELSGYDSFSSFNRSFQKQQSASPTNYRKSFNWYRSEFRD